MDLNPPIDTFVSRIKDKNHEFLIELANEANPVDISKILNDIDYSLVLEFLTLISEDKASLLFSLLERDTQYKVFKDWDKKDFSKIFSLMRSDQRVDFYQSLEAQDQFDFLPYINNATKADLIHLSSYPPESAGGIMSSDFLSFELEQKISEAITLIKGTSRQKSLPYFIYVIDKEQTLQGVLSFRDLLVYPDESKLAEIMNDQVIFGEVDEDREVIVKKMETYDLLALPIVNKKRQILGVVDHAVTISTIREEHTEDLEKFMGITVDPKKRSYLETSSLLHFKKRVYWIVSLAALGIISGIVVHRFEKTLEALMILALYMPMVADTGGNSGSQAATVVVRALALDEITIRDWFKIIWKEFKVSILLAVCLGLLAFGKILFLSYEVEIPEGFTLINIALVITLALSLQVITATVIGAGLPILVKALKGDPAVAASPLITTVVDITGLLLYFSCAQYFLNI